MLLDSNLLAHLSQLLSAADQGVPVFLYAETLPARGRQAAWLQLRQALGGRIEVGGVRPVDAQQACDIVRQCLEGGAQPDGPLLAGEAARQYQDALAELLQQWQLALQEAALIEQFWLSEGHPLPPGAWDFAFMLSNRQQALVFMGAAASL